MDSNGRRLVSIDTTVGLTFIGLEEQVTHGNATANIPNSLVDYIVVPTDDIVKPETTGQATYMHRIRNGCYNFQATGTYAELYRDDESREGLSAGPVELPPRNIIAKHTLDPDFDTKVRS